MSNGYSKVNNDVLKFDCIKDVEKIILNHYFMRKVNINNIKRELPVGQLAISISSVATDLGISRSKAQRLIKEFEKRQIIKSVSKGNLNKEYSVYLYVIGDTDVDTDKSTQEISHMNQYIVHQETYTDVVNDDSKIDNLNKNLNNKNIYGDIVEYLNKVTGKKFKSTTKKTRDCINARIKEGFVLNDFYKVIDTKSTQWLSNDMQKYLRPETLFSNKFEGYLNEVSSVDINEVEVKEWDIEFDY